METTTAVEVPGATGGRGARRKRQGLCAGAAVLVVATVFGGSVALGRGTSEPGTKPAAAGPSTTVGEPITSAVPLAEGETVPAVETSTVRSRPTTTAAAGRPKVRAKAPVYVDGVPQVKATPDAGKVGSRIRVEGYGFAGEQWEASGSSLWLAQVGGCGLYAQAEHNVRVTPDGRLAGELTVPARGSCRQSDRDDEPVTAGRYRIAFSCTACFIGELRVTSAPSSATACRNVGFTPNSDDVASSIVARNVSCTGAEALVRKVGKPLGFNGPATAAADGYRCTRTGREDRVLPAAFYECTNGTKRITFTRT